LKPLDVVVGSTEAARQSRHHLESQCQQAAKRSAPPQTGEPSAELCALQVYKILALFWEHLVNFSQS
jgi:hypothetical protein